LKQVCVCYQFLVILKLILFFLKYSNKEKFQLGEYSCCLLFGASSVVPSDNIDSLSGGNTIFRDKRTFYLVVKYKTRETRRRILGRNWDKSLKSFPPCYSQLPLLRILPPKQARILDTNDLYGNLA
jgi:hypothetical protein